MKKRKPTRGPKTCAADLMAFVFNTLCAEHAITNDDYLFHRCFDLCMAEAEIQFRAALRAAAKKHQ